MLRLSQTLCFLQSPSFQQEQSALIGQLTQCIVIGRTPNQITFIVTSSQHMCLGEWNSWECAPDSAETIYI